MPTGFNIGPIPIRFYGIIIIIGAISAAFLAERQARRRGLNSDLVWDALIWVLIAGVIGARIWHILTPPPSMEAQGITTMFYLTHPLDAIWIPNGGLGIPGAVIGGVVALYFFCRRHKLIFPVWLDIAAPAVALGQAIGRWGNFVNQELYGAPTNLPWGIKINSATNYPPSTRFHPLFLYESLWNLANMALLLWLGRRHADKLKNGDLFLVYLLFYAVGRFLLEFLRLDASQVAGLNANQTVMVVVGLVSGGLLLWRHRRSGGSASKEEQEVTSE